MTRLDAYSCPFVVPKQVISGPFTDHRFYCECVASRHFASWFAVAIVQLWNDENQSEIIRRSGPDGRLTMLGFV